MNAAEAAESLRRDLAPGPYQEMSGWAHAIPQEKRVAIVAVCSEVERLERVARSEWDRHSGLLDRYAKERKVETVADLDALPVRSVVLNAHGIAWQRLVSGWHSTNRPDQDSSTSWDLWYSMRRIRKHRRFRVVFMPDAEAVAENRGALQ